MYSGGYAVAMSKRRKVVWISLLEIEPLSREDEDCAGAFVNGLVVAKSAADAEALFCEAVKELGWKMIAVEETEEFEARTRSFKVPQDVRRLARLAERQKCAQFGTFFTYDHKKKTRKRSGGRSLIRRTPS